MFNKINPIIFNIWCIDLEPHIRMLNTTNPYTFKHVCYIGSVARYPEQILFKITSALTETVIEAPDPHNGWYSNTGNVKFLQIPELFHVKTGLL